MQWSDLNYKGKVWFFDTSKMSKVLELPGGWSRDSFFYPSSNPTYLSCINICCTFLLLEKNNSTTVLSFPFIFLSNLEAEKRLERNIFLKIRTTCSTRSSLDSSIGFCDKYRNASSGAKSQWSQKTGFLVTKCQILLSKLL